MTQRTNESAMVLYDPEMDGRTFFNTSIEHCFVMLLLL
jgi:hypothetical protein